MHIIIITNQGQKAHLLKEYLTVYGLEVTLFFKPMLAVESIKNELVDCILLDYTVTEIDRFQLCELISKLSKSPILMFGGSHDVEQECRAFDVGCVEYIRDPYVLDILVRRVKKCLKWFVDEPLNTKKIVLDNDLVIDIANRSVMTKGTILHLTYKEFEILKLLATNPHRIFTRDEIIDSIWPVGGEVDPRSVDSHIKNIRKKTRTRHIEVIRNIGYRLVKQLS